MAHKFNSSPTWLVEMRNLGLRCENLIGRADLSNRGASLRCELRKHLNTEARSFPGNLILPLPSSAFQADRRASRMKLKGYTKCGLKLPSAVPQWPLPALWGPAKLAFASGLWGGAELGSTGSSSHYRATEGPFEYPRAFDSWSSVTVYHWPNGPEYVFQSETIFLNLRVHLFSSRGSPF